MGTAALVIDQPEVTLPATFDAVIVNLGKRTLDYGLAYTIEHWDSQCWQKTNLAPEVFPLIALILGSGEIGKPNTVKIPADVESGFYRVTKDATEQGTGTALTLHGPFPDSLNSTLPADADARSVESNKQRFWPTRRAMRASLLAAKAKPAGERCLQVYGL